MDLSPVTWALCHARIDIIIGLSSLLALWISVMHFEVFRGRASWEYLESLIQFLIGLTHVDSPGYPLAASLKSNMEIFSGPWGNQTPPAAAEIPEDRDICFHCRKCWFLVHQPAQLWLPSHPMSLFSWCPTACQEALGNISSCLAAASLASLTHTEPTTPTPPLPAGSTGLPEAELKMQGAFSFSSLGKAFYSVNAPWTKQQKAVSKAPDD